MSNVLALYHVVFSTKFRANTISEAHCEDLYKVITNRIKECGSRLLCINGTGDHIHILLDLKPTMALSTLIGNVKQASSIWMTASGFFPAFQGWGREFFGHSVSEKDTEGVKSYIRNQKEHHRRVLFDDELRTIAKHIGVEWHDNILR